MLKEISPPIRVFGTKNVKYKKRFPLLYRLFLLTLGKNINETDIIPKGIAGLMSPVPTVLLSPSVFTLTETTELTIRTPVV